MVICPVSNRYGHSCASSSTAATPLSSHRSAGAIIDTWYQYPSPAQAAVLPSKLPSQTLANVVMAPHMSGWTRGTIERRQRTIADNIAKRFAGAMCDNVVRGEQRS